MDDSRLDCMVFSGILPNTSGESIDTFHFAERQSYNTYDALQVTLVLLDTFHHHQHKTPVQYIGRNYHQP